MYDHFIPLNTYSAYSLAKSALPIDTLLDYATRYEIPAVGLTDRNNLFAALEFSSKAAAKGIQPIIGVEQRIALIDHQSQNAQNASFKTAPQNAQNHDISTILLYATSRDGYENLMAINSASYVLAGHDHDANNNKDESTEQDKFPEDQAISLGFIDHNKQDIMAIIGGYRDYLWDCLWQENINDADRYVKQIKDIFGEYAYIGLIRNDKQSHLDPDSDWARYEENLQSLAQKHDIAVIALLPMFFHNVDDHQAHEILMCIGDGYVMHDENHPSVDPSFYAQKPDVIKKIYADIPETLHNGIAFAQQCCYWPETHPPILPLCPLVTDGDEAGTLRKIATDSLKAKWPELEPYTHEAFKTYEERLEYELSTIINMGFMGYFLIVADFIQWAKKQDIPVGPGRGSGAGSLVAFVLDITTLDPIRWGLLFERFLNPERVSMPDFDIDFCQDRRDEVFAYVKKTYGDDRVAHIITFGKLQARAVMRDVGRVLGMGYGQVDRICKMIPNNPANPVTLSEALDQEPEFKQAYQDDEDVRMLVDYAKKLEGLFRHASTHAAGIVIGDRPLQKIVPLYQDPRSTLPATQFNMKWVEQAGLVKFDFLGLKTLTIIKKTIDFLQQQKIELDIDQIPLDDKKTFAMLSTGNTKGVFQFESAGFQDLMIKLQPERLEELIAAVSLFRPGPMDNIPRYLACRHGKEEPDYLHDMIEPVLKETFGVMIYQEQVMQIAQIMGGYSLGSADLLRRAMGKKIKSEMDAQRALFLEGATQKNIKAKTAEHIFDQMAKFAGYGFNKSHAAAYALIAYQTAYLKCHHPVEFMAATLQYDLTNTDKLAIYAADIREGDIDITPPHVNHSMPEFSVGLPVNHAQSGDQQTSSPYENCVYYALGAVKGVSMAAMDIIAENRIKDGPYTDIWNLLERTPSSSLNKKQLEALIMAGALDELGHTRASLHAHMEKLLQYQQQYHQHQQSSQGNLFEAVNEGAVAKPTIKSLDEWNIVDRAKYEFLAFGFYLVAHPLKDMTNILDSIGLVADANKSEKHNYYMGILTGVDKKKSGSGASYAILKFAGLNKQFDMFAFNELWDGLRDELELNQIYKVSFGYGKDPSRQQLQAVESVNQYLHNVPKWVVHLDNNKDNANNNIADDLAALPSGKSDIILVVSDFKAQTDDDANKGPLFQSDLHINIGQPKNVTIDFLCAHEDLDIRSN